MICEKCGSMMIFDGRKMICDRCGYEMTSNTCEKCGSRMIFYKSISRIVFHKSIWICENDDCRWERQSSGFDRYMIRYYRGRSNDKTEIRRF